MKTEDDLRAIIKHLNLPYEVAPLQFFDAMQGHIDGRYALFYDVGGGKTLVSTLIAMLNDEVTWVSMPHILLPQWRSWLKRARVPEDQIYTYYGPRRDINEAKKAKWILTSHAIFRKDARIIREEFRKVKKTLLLDEAQIIKDTRSKIYQAVSLFIGAEGNFVPMSATPTAKPEDTYAYMKLKTPALYRSRTHWDSLHVAELDFFGGIKRYANLDLLRDNFAIKAAKRDKKDLFGFELDPILTPVEYELSPKHYKLYKKLLEEQLIKLPNGDKIDATTHQTLRHMMQQIIWDPSRFSGDPSDVPAGFEWLETECDGIDFMTKGNSKYVIWTYYRSTTEAIYKWMQEKYGKTGVAAYGGSNSAKAVENIMFNEDCRWAVFNPLSVGAGLELQHVCNQSSFAELTTTPIPVRQAIGRFPRPGQKVRPTIRFAQAIGTVQVSLYNDLLRNDERVSYIERTKTSLREDILGIVK